ncbi:MerR family transcriptional regulator [bacterium]|nr:MerR family transcriptional regulator [bacterium]
MTQYHTAMKISDLSTLSDTPVSTIKYYIRESLLLKPVKTGETRGTYTIRHTERLKLIKKLQKEGLALNKIREIIRMLDTGEENEKNDIAINASDIKFELIRSAIQLFREKGYEAVTIADIVDKLQIGCSTFYKHFKNKKELFVQCIRKIIADETAGFSLYEGSDMSATFEREVESYLEHDLLWRDMIRMLRAASTNDPDEFKAIHDEAIQLRINMYKNNIKNAVDLGVYRKIDQTLFAVMLLGIQEYCSEYYYTQMNITEAERKKIAKEANDIIHRGVLMR